MKKRIFSLLLAFILIMLQPALIASAADEVDDDYAFPHAIAFSNTVDIGVEKNVTAITALEYETKRIVADTKGNEKFEAEGLSVWLMALYTAARTVKGDSVKISAAAIIDAANNPLSLKPDMVIAVVDLIASALYNGDVNAIAALAINTAGSVADFVKNMNKCAKSIGMKESSFTNITGKPDAAQVTTVNDLMILAFFCYSSKFITDATSAESQYIRTDAIMKSVKSLTNPFELVKSDSEYYNGNIYGIGAHTDSKGVTTSIVTFITLKQKYIIVLRSTGKNYYSDIVTTLDYLQKNYALLDISKVIFELGENTTVTVNGEKVYFEVMKNSVKNVNVVANLYYSKSVSTVNDAYKVVPPENFPSTVKIGDAIKNFEVYYNDGLVSSMTLVVKSIGEKQEEEETLGFTIYEKDTTPKKAEGNFFKRHSWIAIAGVMVIISFAVIIGVNNLKNI